MQTQAHAEMSEQEPGSNALIQATLVSYLLTRSHSYFVGSLTPIDKNIDVECRRLSRRFDACFCYMWSKYQFKFYNVPLENDALYREYI